MKDIILNFQTVILYLFTFTILWSARDNLRCKWLNGIQISTATTETIMFSALNLTDIMQPFRLLNMGF